MNKHYKCLATNKVFALEKSISGCPLCDKYYNNLFIEYDYKNSKIREDSQGHPWAKYLDLLPNSDFKISFHEEKTPLIRINNFANKYGFEDLYLKDESKNPTTSFKDRGALVLINCLVEWGINQVFVVSSGNDAISTAAYASKAGIKCDCLVSTSLSENKLDLLKALKPNIVRHDGSYEDIFRWAIDTSYDTYNATGGFNPLKEEGIKIISFEIFEDISVPDIIIAPCGNGTLLYSIYKGFKELHLLGLTDKMPKLIGVQVKNAAPLKKSFEEQKDFVVLENIPDSIAEGIIASESFSSPKLMHALKETGGEILEVEEEEIEESLEEIKSLENLDPEPTSASVFAAAKKIQEKNQKVVLVMTAGGDKNISGISSRIS
jgi:threonine synthase